MDTTITDNHRRLLDLEPGDNPEWLSYDLNRGTIYAIADRVSEFMGADDLSEDEALLYAYAERLAEVEAKAAKIKAMAARLLAVEEAAKKSLEVCFERAVERRARERMPARRKTLATMFGVYRFRSTPRKVDWPSQDIAVAWAERNAPGLVKMETRITDKNALRREVEAWSAQHGGELPEGFLLMGGVESFSVSAAAEDDDPQASKKGYDDYPVKPKGTEA